MSETNPEPPIDGVQEPQKTAEQASSPSPSEKSIKSDVSNASSRLPKPSGMRPPSSTATIRKPSTSSITSASTPTSTRIGRLCTSHGHGAKAGPPPLELHKSKYHFSIACFFFFVYGKEKKYICCWYLISCRRKTLSTVNCLRNCFTAIKK